MSDTTNPPPGLKVLEFPSPEPCPVCSSWAEGILANASNEIAQHAAEHNDPVSDIAVCVVYGSGKVECHWEGSRKLQLVGGLQYMQRMVMEEEV